MTDSQRLARSIQLSALAAEADLRWPESPTIAKNLRWGAQYQLSRIARRAA